MTTLTFLGTGNFYASKRYWNSFVIDGNVLVEPSPIALPHLRRTGIAPGSLDVVVISHFHADHTFGWPFLLLELMREHDTRPLFVVGPPGVEQYLRDMVEMAGVPDIQAAADERLDMRYVEVDGAWQEAGPLRLRAVEVEHVPHLRCFGYLFARGDRVLGYSGDTRPCPGLEELASASDAMVLECNSTHRWSTHLHVDAVRDLGRRFPDVHFVLSHLGDDVVAENLPGFTVPDDFATVDV